MSRATWALDRMAVVVTGLLLIALGALGFVWRMDVWSALKQPSDTSGLGDVLNSDWWPWAVTGAGLLLILVGLRWLWAHLPGRSVGDLNLPGTGEHGRLRFSAKAAASTAADILADLPAVRSTKGTVLRDRGQLVVDLKATVDPDVNLEELAESADQIVADLATVTGRKDIYGRVHIVVSRASSSLPRVI